MPHLSLEGEVAPAKRARVRGILADMATRPSLREHARELRQRSTDAERILWRELRGRRFVGSKFRRQHPLGNYIVDFCRTEAGLTIELDGGQHSELESDLNRTADIEQMGFRELRFWNTDVLANLSGVLQRIDEALKA